MFRRPQYYKISHEIFELDLINYNNNDLDLKSWTFKAIAKKLRRSGVYFSRSAQNASICHFWQLPHLHAATTPNDKGKIVNRLFSKSAIFQKNWKFLDISGILEFFWDWAPGSIKIIKFLISSSKKYFQAFFFRP